jgi:hypothetical protein
MPPSSGQHSFFLHDQIRVAPDLEMLDPELYSDPETIDQGFVLGGVV